MVISMVVAVMTGVSSFALAQQWQERPDWVALFRQAGVSGTVAVADDRSQARWVCDGVRAAQRFIPASTFKVPHALIALEAGLVHDEFQVFRWDGITREVDTWNGDQNLRSSMRNSTVWVFQRLARRLGERRERHYLQRLGYGNADPQGGIDRFWLEGNLRISAVEQVEFLRRLFQNRLPVRIEHQRLVKDLLIVEAGRDWILRAKTGWAARVRPQIGWWVGWVERPDGAVFFALNIDIKNAAEDAPKREAIVRTILQGLGVLPR